MGLGWELVCESFAWRYCWHHKTVSACEGTESAGAEPCRRRTSGCEGAMGVEGERWVTAREAGQPSLCTVCRHSVSSPVKSPSQGIMDSLINHNTNRLYKLKGIRQSNPYLKCRKTESERLSRPFKITRQSQDQNLPHGSQSSVLFTAPYFFSK